MNSLLQALYEAEATFDKKAIKKARDIAKSYKDKHLISYEIYSILLEYLDNI